MTMRNTIIRCLGLRIAFIQVHLETWFWGQKNINLHNFGVTMNTVVIIGRQAIHVKGNLIPKTCLYRTSPNTARQLSVCCHGYTFTIVTNTKSTT